MKKLSPFFVVIALAVIGQPVYSAPAFEAGQVWEYRTRPNESASRIFIVKTDHDEKVGTIYHIYVDGLRIVNSKLSSGYQSYLPHAAVNGEALESSVVALVSSWKGDMPDIEERYIAWREAYLAGEAAVFSVSIASLVSYTERIAAARANQ